MDARIKELGVFILTTVTALGNFLWFGLAHYRTWSDAQEYSAYATHLVQNGLYSFDGAHFDIAREPGYPFFLALLYKIFGAGNLLAVCFLQALLLGILGYVIYRVFVAYKENTIGIVAALVVSALPSYGYYTNELLTEMLFGFFLALLFFVSLKIIKKRGSTAWHWFVLFGFLCGYATLVRVQFLFFLPFAIFCYLVFARSFSKEIFQKIVASCAICIVVVGVWGVYVQRHTGHFAITAGRQESVIHIRAVRAELSYGELTQYAIEWVKRSVSGGAHYALLDANEAKGINQKYFAIATTSAAVAQIEHQDAANIASHPGQYLYGNLIEVMKMLYIEHDYTDSQSRYFRPVEYGLIYVFFLFGLYQIFRNRKEKDMHTLAFLALLFPFYNLLVLSFFDTVPRFNTPYLMFYIIIGFIGVVLFRRARGRPRA